MRKFLIISLLLLTAGCASYSSSAQASNSRTDGTTACITGKANALSHAAYFHQVLYEAGMDVVSSCDKQAEVVATISRTGRPRADGTLDIRVRLTLDDRSGKTRRVFDQSSTTVKHHDETVTEAASRALSRDYNLYLTKISMLSW